MAEYWILSIEYNSEFVAKQRNHAKANGFAILVTPREEVYMVSTPELAGRIGIDKNNP